MSDQTAIILDGAKTAEAIKLGLSEQVKEIEERFKTRPTLAVVLVGDDPASKVYVKNKHIACKKIGINSRDIQLPENIEEEALLDVVEKLNEAPEVNGILVQLPLPAHFEPWKIISSILPEKDVDGLHPVNAGALASGHPRFIPCTPLGVMAVLDTYKIPVEGKNAVVIGRSNLVGKPLIQLLLARNATVTSCHSKTRNLQEVARSADILISAIGKPKFVTADFVKKGAVVIDVGTSSHEGKLTGDVDFEAVKNIASAITPVPRGIGPMTITMLLQNTVKAFLNQRGE